MSPKRIGLKAAVVREKALIAIYCINGITLLVVNGIYIRLNFATEPFPIPTVARLLNMNVQVIRQALNVNYT
jgi:hypothetical protein